MGRIGLVLAGGGGKGAYHIGVWKALAEYGIDKYISIVTGSSVGALNMILFANEDLARAEYVWRNISHDKILTIPKKISAGLHMPEEQAAIFSRDGLSAIIDENVDLNKISRSKIRMYACTYNVTRKRTEYLSINNKSSSMIKKIVMASSALPIIFGKQEINGMEYYDGGLTNNVPVEPIFNTQADGIIAVHLGRESSLNKIYPNKNIIEIVPAKNQGDLLDGTLDFSSEGARRRISQGYEDTVKIIEPVRCLIQEQAGYIYNIEKLVENECRLEEKIKDIYDRRSIEKDKIKALRRGLGR